MASCGVAVDLIYSAPVAVKYMLHGRWSWKTLGGMVLIVRPGTIEVVHKIRPLGAILGGEWVFDDAPKTRCEVSHSPSPRLRSREWIVLASTQTGKPESVAIAATKDMDALWRALIESGAHPASDPPSRGAISGSPPE
jgi:hypothetical protein